MGKNQRRRSDGVRACVCVSLSLPLFLSLFLSLSGTTVGRCRDQQCQEIHTQERRDQQWAGECFRVEEKRSVASRRWCC